MCKCLWFYLYGKGALVALAKTFSRKYFKIQSKSYFQERSSKFILAGELTNTVSMENLDATCRRVGATKQKKAGSLNIAWKKELRTNQEHLCQTLSEQEISFYELCAIICVGVVLLQLLQICKLIYLLSFENAFPLEFSFSPSVTHIQKLFKA